VVGRGFSGGGNTPLPRAIVPDWESKNMAPPPPFFVRILFHYGSPRDLHKHMNAKDLGNDWQEGQEEVRSPGLLVAENSLIFYFTTEIKLTFVQRQSIASLQLGMT